MSIIQYFNQLIENISLVAATAEEWDEKFDEISELEEEVYAMLQDVDNEDRFNTWCAEHGIDSEHEDTTFWAWDMCND